MPVMKTMYDRETNAPTTAYAVNVDSAVKKFPDRWSLAEWPADKVGKVEPAKADEPVVEPPKPVAPVKPAKPATPEVDRARMDELKAEYLKITKKKAPGFLNTLAALEGAVAKAKAKAATSASGGAAGA
jgi:hypothetical protein